MRTARWVPGLVLASAAGAVLGGCDKLTRNHYEMIVLNVATDDDVERTIGEPSQKMGDKWHYERVDKHLNVFIDFDEAGVVVRKQWIDAAHPSWEDTATPGDSDSYESTRVRTINE